MKIEKSLDQQILHTLRRSLIGVVALLDKVLDLPPTYPTKEERQLLSILRKKGIDLKTVRQFLRQQLT